MHSIQLKIDESIFDKVMTMLELLPQDKIKVEDNGYDYPVITEYEARMKVQKAINSLNKGNGQALEQAFENIFTP